MGLLAAVERYHRIDHDAERKELDSRAEHVTTTLNAIDGVETSVDIPEIANHVPHVMVTWDAAAKGLTPSDAAKKLRAGDPAIAVSQNAEGLRISMWTLQPGEHEIVAKHVKELLA